MATWTSQTIPDNIPEELDLIAMVQAADPGDKLPAAVQEVDGAIVPNPDLLDDPTEDGTMSLETMQELAAWIMQLGGNGLPMWWTKGKPAFQTAFHRVLLQQEGLTMNQLDEMKSWNPASALASMYRTLWSMFHNG